MRKKLLKFSEIWVLPWPDVLIELYAFKSMKCSFQGRPRRKRGGRGGKGGLLVYLYTRKKKYLKFLPIYPKLPEALYTVKPKLVIYTWNLEKWFTQYPSSSWNIPYTQFKKPLYSAYPKSPGLPWILRAMLTFTHDNMHIPRVYYATGRADILVVNRHFIYGLV